MRLALGCLVAPLLLGLATARSASEAAAPPASLARRAFRELSAGALDALTAPDRELDGFLDPAVDGGGLKSILIPRVGQSASLPELTLC